MEVEPSLLLSFRKVTNMVGRELWRHSEVLLLCLELVSDVLTDSVCQGITAREIYKWSSGVAYTT